MSPSENGSEIKVKVVCSNCKETQEREPWDGEELVFVNGYIFSKATHFCTDCIRLIAEAIGKNKR